MLPKYEVHIIFIFEGSELLPLGVTFFCCLFINMEYGILIGTGFHLLLLTYMSNRSRPSFVVQQEVRTKSYNNN